MLSWIPFLLFLAAFVSIFLLTGKGIMALITFYILLTIHGLIDMAFSKYRFLSPGLGLSVIIAKSFDGILGLYFFLLFNFPVTFYQLLEDDLKKIKTKKNTLVNYISYFGFFILMFYVFKFITKTDGFIYQVIACLVYVLFNLVFFALIYKGYYKARVFKEMLSKLFLSNLSILAVGMLVLKYFGSILLSSLM